MRCIMTFKELDALIENNLILTRFDGGRPMSTYNYEKDNNYVRLKK